MSDGDSLKQKNQPWLASYLACHAIIISYIALGRFPTNLDALKTMDSLECVKVLGGFLVTFLALFLNELPSREIKEWLVFWGGKNALPSARFVELSKSDQRFHISQLQERLQGSLPTTPTEQTLVWNKLYRQHDTNGAVLAVHQQFLLMRDITWLTTLLAVVGCICIYVGTEGFRPMLHYLWVSMLCYLAFGISARTRANRFVLTVLACEAAKAETRSRIITDHVA